MTTPGPPTVCSTGDAARGRSAPRLNPVDALVGLLIAGSLVYWFRELRGIWFYMDEWAMAEQVRDPWAVFEPYNGHLSVTILAVYRTLLEVFGFSTHAPYRLIGLLAYGSIAAAFYLTTRSRLGPILAGAASVLLVWAPNMSLEPGALNHWLALSGGIVCAYGLTGRTRRHDILVASALAFSLCGAGGGVAIVVAATVHSLCTRATARRWLAVLIPAGLWGLWRVTMVPPEAANITSRRPEPADLVSRAVGDAHSSFSQLALGHEGIGRLFGVAFVLFVLLRLRHGLAHSAAAVAWSVALLTWWLGLEWARWLLPTEDVFRYDTFSAVLILMALVPDTPLPVSPWDFPSRRSTVAASAAVACLVVLSIAVARDDFVRFRDWGSLTGWAQHQQSVAIDLKPPVVPDDATTSLGFLYFTAGDLRSLFAAYAPPDGAQDREGLVASVARLEIADGGPPAHSCQDPIRRVTATPLAIVSITAPDGPSRIEVRRFGSGWVDVGTIPDGGSALLSLPDLLSTAEWEIRSTTSVCAVVR